MDIKELTKDELDDLINKDKIPYTQLGKRFNCSGNYVKKYASKLGIELPKRITSKGIPWNKGITAKIEYHCLNCGNSILSTSPRKFCNSKCQGKYTSRKSYENFLNHPEEYNRWDAKLEGFKRHIYDEQNNKCDICGMNREWNGKPINFVLDHIDGNASHNVRSNLRLICHNCDSQLDTYKSKNKNSARKYLPFTKKE